MTDAPKEQVQTPVIGRGESIIVKKHPDADVEAENSSELVKREDDEIAGLKESEGWWFPKVKLSAWVSIVNLAVFSLANQSSIKGAYSVTAFLF